MYQTNFDYFMSYLKQKMHFVDKKVDKNGEHQKVLKEM